MVLAVDVTPIAQHILTQPDAEMRDAELANAMASLDAADQAILLRRLFREGDATMASQSLVMLIQRDEIDDATLEVLDLDIRNWNPSLQLAAISAIGSISDIERRRQFADVTRTATEVALDQNEIAVDRERVTLVDWSILALSRMDDPRAVADAKAVIQRMPESSGAWIVLLDSGAVGADERAIAQVILNDAANGVPLRSLAAIALGGSNAAAHVYYDSIINGIIDQYGQQTLREMMVSRASAPSGDPARQAYSDFLRDGRAALSYLSLVRDGSLDATLRRCVSANNECVRDMARFAIATGSPQMVLEDPACIQNADQLLEAAAGAAILHPDLQNVLAQRFGVEPLEAAIERVRGSGGIILGQAAPPIPCEP